MNYCIKLKAIKVRKVSINIVDFDLFLNFTNKSSAGFTILSQHISIYINNKFISKVVNNSPNIILPNSTSIVGANVKFSPQELGNVLKSNAINLLTNWDKITIKADIKMRVKLWFFTVNIPYVYESTLKELTKPNPENTAESSKDC